MDMLVAYIHTTTRHRQVFASKRHHPYDSSGSRTIEQQLESVRTYYQSHGWPWQEEHIFRDDGYSGAKLHRPGLDRLREHVGRAAFDRIVMTARIDLLATTFIRWY